MHCWKLIDVKTILEGFEEVEIIPNCCRTQKSFYGKATQITKRNGNKYLKSYETIVASIDSNGAFHRLWKGWSATTAKHIDSFRRNNGLEGICKKDWKNLKVEEA